MEYREGTLSKVGGWLAVLMVANLMWMGLTILGLGIFGWMPATHALFETMQAVSTKGYQRVNVWKQMWLSYKKWWQSYLSRSGIFAFGIFVFGLNITAFSPIDAFLPKLVFYIMIVMSLLWLAVWLWVPYIRAHYPKMAWKEILQNSFCLPMAHPLQTLVQAVWFVLCYLVIWDQFMGAIAFIGFSVPLFGFYFSADFILQGKLFRSYQPE